MLNIFHALMSGTLKFMALTTTSLLAITFIHVKRLSVLFSAFNSTFLLPVMELVLYSWLLISPLTCRFGSTCGRLQNTFLVNRTELFISFLLLCLLLGSVKYRHGKRAGENGQKRSRVTLNMYSVLGLIPSTMEEKEGEV